MPRSNRYFQAGHIYHVTHRCHQRKFLLAFKKDKQRYRYWLFKATQHYHLSVLNYVITSNHIHLLVADRGEDSISNSMRFTASRLAYEFNRRKKKDNGSFWEGRFFSTAVQSGDYLLNCMIYIDFNMVRCGAVKHPKEWQFGGYSELLKPRKRYCVIDIPLLLKLFGFSNLDEFMLEYNQQINQRLESPIFKREPRWTEKVAVGDPEYVKAFQQQKGAEYFKVAF